jgi:hypothetical protein
MPFLSLDLAGCLVTAPLPQRKSGKLCPLLFVIGYDLIVTTLVNGPDAQAPVAVKSRSAVAGFALLATSFLLLGETLATSDRPTVAVVYGGLSLAGYAASLFCLAGTRRDVGLSLASWKLGPWMLLWYGLAFGVTTVTWSKQQTGVAAEISVSSVLRALCLVAVGLTAWAVGYCMGPGRPARRVAVRLLGTVRRRYGMELRGPGAPWILYSVGISARLALTVGTGKFGYIGEAASSASAPGAFDGIFGALSLAAPLAVAAAAMQVFQEQLPRARTTLIILFFGELAFGAAAGNKQGFIVAVLAVGIPFSATRHRLPKSALLGTLLVFLLIVIPFNRAYRNADHDGSPTPGLLLTEAPGIFKETVTGDSVVTVIPNSIEFLARRIREIDNPAIIVQRMPGQIPFLRPIDLIVSPIVGFVPRAIWPDKPIRATGAQFTREYYELPATTVSADTPIGGLYWYGGWVPVIVGMFLLGCGVRLLDTVLDVRKNMHAIFLVLLIFPLLVKGEDDLASILASIPGILLVWLVAVAITFRSRRQYDGKSAS